MHARMAGGTSRTPLHGARRGRRPGPGVTRRAILDAERRRFAEPGFVATPIRAEAADADAETFSRHVAPSLQAILVPRPGDCPDGR